MSREKAKLERVIGGIAQINRLPSAIFMVDISHEHIALAEAKKLGLTTFGMVDTNSDPTSVDFAIPANDDASKSVTIITKYLTEAIKEGLAERKQNKEDMIAAKHGENDGEDGGEAKPKERSGDRRRAAGGRRKKTVKADAPVEATPKKEEKVQEPAKAEAAE